MELRGFESVTPSLGTKAHRPSRRLRRKSQGVICMGGGQHFVSFRVVFGAHVVRDLVATKKGLATGKLQSQPLNTRMGHDTDCTSFSVTLPMSHRPRPLRPWLDIRIAVGSSFSTTARIASAALISEVRMPRATIPSSGAS